MTPATSFWGQKWVTNCLHRSTVKNDTLKVFNFLKICNLLIMWPWWICAHEVHTSGGASTIHYCVLDKLIVILNDSLGTIHLILDETVYGHELLWQLWCSRLWVVKKKVVNPCKSDCLSLTVDHIKDVVKSMAQKLWT